MGNMIRDVRPISFQSPRARDSAAVNITSRHHPATPHFKKFSAVFFISLIIFIRPVCAALPKIMKGSGQAADDFPFFL